MIAEVVQFTWPSAAVAIAAIVSICVAGCVIARSMDDDNGSITVWFELKKPSLTQSWKGKDQGRKADDPGIPSTPAPPKNGASPS